MAKANHSTSGSGGSYCACCGSSVGEPVKVQPTIVDGKRFCPRCFTWVRQNEEPGRFEASQTMAVKCAYCGWASVCIGVSLGHRAHCGHCHRTGALPLPMTNDAIREFRELARMAVEKTIVEKTPA